MNPETMTIAEPGAAVRSHVRGGLTPGAVFVETINSGRLIVLSDAATQDIAGLIQHTRYRQEHRSQDEQSLLEIFSRVPDIPATLYAELVEFRRSSDSYLLIKNLPGTRQDETLLLLTRVVGLPFAHADEGPLIMSVRPDGQAERSGVSAYYTWNRFDLHTELSYVSAPPDFLGLWCIHNVRGGFTYVASLERALPLLSSDDLAELQAPQFSIPVPPHFGSGSRPSPRRPLLRREHGRWRLRVRFDGLDTDSTDARRAVARLREALDTVREAFELEESSLLLIDNRLAAHGRAAFVPTFDAVDRELHRVYLTVDPEAYGDRYDSMTRRVSGF